MRGWSLFLAMLVLVGWGDLQAQRRVLFDASHRENASQADWIIDADNFDLNQAHYPCGPSDFADESRAQRFPTPDASAVTTSTPETYWTGGISAFGLDLVKIGFDVESLPVGGAISFGDLGNPQDLSLYDVFVLPEPNQPFTAAETTAIRDFVAAGGGLFLITDHQTSDRDCDGSDSPHIGNDLMGVVISGGTITDHGLFGIVFNVEEIAGQTSTDYWFTDGVDDNVSLDPLDPIIAGPHGSGAGGLGFFGATSMSIDSATNPTVEGHVWKTDAGGQGSSRVTFATSWYVNGRIACIGDSSPADDGTGDPADSLHDGWDKADGGVANKEIHLNAVEWLAGADLVAPTIETGPVAVASDCSATVNWTTNERSNAVVDYGTTAAYGSSASDSTTTQNHQIALPVLSPNTLYHFRVSSTDIAGNGPTSSGDLTFTTSAAANPVLLSGPTVGPVTSHTAAISWTTDEPADTVVDYGTTLSLGTVEGDPSPTTDHTLTLTGLMPATTYHFRSGSSDPCGNGPVWSATETFVTAPPELDISGWTLLQYGSSQSFVFPAGTVIPGGGYLVLARDATRPSFESEWGPLPSGTAYVDSGETLPLINGGESFELTDDLGATVDGQTIAMAAGTAIQRNEPSAPAGVATSWTQVANGAGNPGAGVGAPSGAGVVINEAADATAFANEFVELFYDTGPAEPDTVPPVAVTDLAAEPLSGSSVRLSWTAPGDDGAQGMAAVYDVRVASTPITSEAAFLSATPLSGAPTPAGGASPEIWEVPGLDSETTYYFALRAADESANLSSVSNTAGATTGTPGSGGGGTVADHLVISEIQTRGVTDSDDEFIELYNPTGSAVNVTGWSLQYKSATGSTFLVSGLPSVSIPANAYLLVARPEYVGSVAADATYGTFLMGAGGGHVFVVGSGAPLSFCTDPAIVDKIGYGTANCPETAAAPAHVAGSSIERKPGILEPSCGNGLDSDDNSADVDLLTPPDPQNSLSSEAPCGTGAGPGNVGNSLFWAAANTDELRWAAALDAESYKVRRSTNRAFMTTHPVPDDTYLLAQPAGVTAVDTGTPTAGAVYYYFVNATLGPDESDD